MCCAGHQDIIYLRVLSKANIDTRDSDIPTTLVRAVEYGNTEAVSTLLELGAMIDSQNDEGWTALSGAANSGHADTVRTLLKHGSSANKLDDRGSAPIFYAHKHKDKKIIDLLKSAEAK